MAGLGSQIRVGFEALKQSLSRLTERLKSAGWETSAARTCDSLALVLHPFRHKPSPKAALVRNVKWSLINLVKIELTAETESYIEESVRSGAFASPSEFVEAAARRQMQEEAWFEQKVLEGLEGTITPLTKEDLNSVRDIVKP